MNWKGWGKIRWGLERWFILRNNLSCWICLFSLGQIMTNETVRTLKGTSYTEQSKAQFWRAKRRSRRGGGSQWEWKKVSGILITSHKLNSGNNTSQGAKLGNSSINESTSSPCFSTQRAFWMFRIKTSPKSSVLPLAWCCSAQPLLGC